MKTMTQDKRKVLLIFPLLILPFIALVFYAMGGGKRTANLDMQRVQKGINADLPDASFKNIEPANKLDFYRQSEKRSAPNEKMGLESAATRLGFNNENDELQSIEIEQKLEVLNKEINKPVEARSTHPAVIERVSQPTEMKSDIDRLENLMKSMQHKEEDPEMTQLNEMLQSIMEIQNPTRIEQSTPQRQFAEPDSLFKAIPAIIADNQKAVQGATVKICLQDSIHINGLIIPKGHELFGICRITNQRLLLDIRNIRLGTSIIPVDLSVYSLDGMMGIKAPEAMIWDAINGGTNDALRSIRLATLDQTFAAQAAGAGIDAAKTLFSKRMKRIKVRIDAGHPILLRNNKPDKSIH